MAIDRSSVSPVPAALRYTPSRERRKLGHITPSSNTVLEPMTIAMSRELDDAVSHHFARIRVEAISLDPRHTSQFSADRMLEVAGLLADAGVDAITWNGTSAGWNGIASDRDICARITESTGVAATTSTLAQLEALARLGIRRVGLALPYTDDVAARIAEVMTGAGLEVVSVANAGVSDNRSMAYVDDDTTLGLARAAAAADPDCVLIYCTGVAGAHLVPELESELGIPVHDSVAVTLWKGLELVGVEPRLTGWGSLFGGEVPSGLTNQLSIGGSE